MLEFTESPADFLASADEHLAADPVVTTLIASVTARLAARPGAYGEVPYTWWAIARGEDQQVSGVAMRTAPFEPYPAYVLPMPEDAALALAQALHGRDEPLAGVNGALPAAQIVAEETARLTGGTAAVDEHLRLFELGALEMPAGPPGRLRAAVVDDADLCLGWFREFHRAAAEQVGREGTHGMGEFFTLDDMLARIEDQVIWLWVDEDERPVHLTGASPPAAGVSRIGPVYTPREHRGRGYASRAVAEVSRLHVDRGVRCCLFTDQANPTSNKIYEAIGYRPVADMVNLVITGPTAGTGPA